MLSGYVPTICFCDGLPELVEPTATTLRRLGKAATGSGKGKTDQWPAALQLAHMECRVAVQKAVKTVLQRRMPLQVRTPPLWVLFFSFQTVPNVGCVSRVSLHACADA